MADAEFSFTPNATPVIELGIGDTRVPTGTGVWDSALWDSPSAVWQGVEPSWSDVSCYAVEADIARGRDRATDRFVPGTAGITLVNTNGWADLSGSPYDVATLAVRPGRSVRVGVDVHSIGVTWLFRGVIDKVTPSYDPVHADVVRLDCIDLLGEVGHVKLPESSPVGADDTVRERIERILDACGHPDEKRIVAFDDTELIQTSYGALAVDLLGVAADSAGGVVYGDEEGRVVYKEFGWQTYESGPPNGGALGNVEGGSPGSPAVVPEPYLTASGAPITTPDSPSLTLPLAFTVFATVSHPTGGTGVSFLCGQWATSGQFEWMIDRNRANGKWFLTTSTNGVAPVSGAFTSINTPPTGDVEVWALSVVLDDGAGFTRLRAYRRAGGDDLNPLWVAADDAQVVPILGWADRTSPLSIGNAAGLTSRAWQGKIYDVELAAGQSPAPKGSTVWRFDVSDQSIQAWLNPTLGSVTTPDKAMPPTFHLLARVRKTTRPSGADAYVASQAASGQYSWAWGVAAAGANTFDYSTVGTSMEGSKGVSGAPTAATDDWFGFHCERPSGGTHSYGGLVSSDGVTWTDAGGGGTSPTGFSFFDSNAAIAIGRLVAGSIWDGRIYWAELRAGDDFGAGSVIWRFDAAEYPGTGTTYTDPRGVAWTLSTTGVIVAETGWTDPRGRAWTIGGASTGVVHPLVIPADPGVPADVCPAAWEVSYDRMELATRVELNRLLPEPMLATMQWVLDGATSGAPTSGHARFNNGDQQVATLVSLHAITNDGFNTEPFLRNLTLGARLNLSDVGDVTNNTRQYTVTGTATRIADGAGGWYYSVPIAWVEGVTGIGGLIQAQMTLVNPEPYVLDDATGQALYGIETFELIDLISIDDTMFVPIADRALKTRGYGAMPRLEAVTLDAKASRGDMAAMETMALCRPEVPTRYQCRLRLDDGRIVFDRNMFAVGTRHFIARDEWTVRISLDDADWAASPTGIVAVTEITDVAAIVGTVTTPSNFGPVTMTEAADTVAIVGTHVTHVGVVALVDADDVAVITAEFIPGTGAIVDMTEANDVTAIAGSYGPRGVVARIEANDVAAITGTVT